MVKYSSRGHVECMNGKSLQFPNPSVRRIALSDAGGRFGP